MLLIRMDEAIKILEAAKTLRNKLVIRYLLFAGLASSEVTEAQIEHIDFVEGTLYLPRRHWGKDGYPCIDQETLHLTAKHIGNRKTGPIIRGWHDRPVTKMTIWRIVRAAAIRADVRCADKIGPRTLKYVFATTWLKPKQVPFLARCPCCDRVFQIFIPLPGSVGTLQKQLSHKKLESTAAYLRFVMDDVRPEHERLIRYVEAVQAGSIPIDPTLKKQEVVEWVETVASSTQRRAVALMQLRNLEA